MSDPDIRPYTAEDEIAVRHPVLRQMVEAARAQPTPGLGFDAEALHAAWRARGGPSDGRPDPGTTERADAHAPALRSPATRRGAWAVGLAVAAAVLLTVGWLRWGTPSPDGEAADASVVVDDRARDDAREDSTPRMQPTAAPGSDTADAISLADTIAVAALDPETTAAPEILGSHRLRLPSGRWSVDSSDAAPVTVLVPDGTLELRGGLIHVEVAGDVSRVDVLRSSVVHIDAEGHRSPLALTTDDPAALARAAERYMAAGDRDRAIQTLERLVTEHPGSPATRVGLVDLARLLRAAGRTDEARCAYALFLERWPGDALAGDVSRAQRALGSGPACHGLRPQP